MQRYSEKFEKEIIKHLRIAVIIILAMELILVGWLEISSFQSENTILKTESKNNVDKWFDEQISLLDSYLSYISSDTSMLKDYDTTQKYLESAAKEKKTLLAAYVGSPTIKTKMICSDNWIPEDSDYKVEDREWYSGAKENDGLYVSEPYVDATYGNLCISISKPIPGTDAVIVIDIDLTTLQKSIGSFCTDMQNVTLVSSKGVIVSCPIKEYALTEKTSTKLADTPLGKAQGENGSLIRTSGISFYEASLQPLDDISYKLYVGVGLRNLLIKLFILIVGILAMLVIISIIMKKRIVTSITKGFVPFEIIKKKMFALSECDLDVVFHEETDIIDIQELQDSLDLMTKNLRSYIKDIDNVLSEISNDNLNVKSEIEYQGDFAAIQDSINNIVSKVRNILQEINEVSTTLNLSSEEIASAASEIAENSADQTSSMGQLQGEFEQFREDMRQIHEQILSTNQAINENSNALSQIGETDMQELSGSMQKISDSSAQISAFVSMIEDISTQTQLLSLNASIEAARAGDSGRGFAVVAEEISKLSEDTLKVNLEIEELIRNNNEFVKEGIHIVDSTRETMFHSIEEYRRMSGQINDITQILDMLFGKIREIDKELKRSAHQGEQNMSMTEECYAHTEELLSSSETLKGNVEKYVL